MKNINACIIAIVFLPACNSVPPEMEGIDFKQKMRDLVIEISNYAKATDTTFIVIPQNGQELVTDNGKPDGTPNISYLKAIDGIGREDLFYGYNSDNKATKTEDTQYMTAFLDICKQNGVQVLVTDYCSDKEFTDASYSKNHLKNYLSFAAPERSLNVIPSYPENPFYANNRDIKKLSEASNFLYLINPEKFQSKEGFISALMNTNYDILIIDYAFLDENTLTKNEIQFLKTKKNGGKRLVFAYMSIGEAENYRYYWNNNWKTGNPEWLEKENPSWKGNYKVRYWYEEWQYLILGNPNSYLDKIISAGFSGVYLDIIDAFEYFEEEYD